MEHPAQSHRGKGRTKPRWRYRLRSRRRVVRDQPKAELGGKNGHIWRFNGCFTSIELQSANQTERRCPASAIPRVARPIDPQSVLGTAPRNRARRRGARVDQPTYRSLSTNVRLVQHQDHSTCYVVLDHDFQQNSETTFAGPQTKSEERLMTLIIRTLTEEN
jgi:hypothetical protein